MRKQPIAAWIALILFCGGTVASAFNPGDSLISYSYAMNAYINTVKEKAKHLTEKLAQPQKQFEALTSELTQDGLKEKFEVKVLGALGESTESKLHTGSMVTAQEGTEIILTAGKAVTQKGTWINLSVGTQVPPQHILTVGHRYLAVDNGSEITMQEDSTLIISGSHQESSAQTDGARYTAYADALHELGLFQGSQKGYELTRQATRVEGVVMLIRLLGDETEAKAYQGKHPFTDVPDWANSYIAYAFQKGYTSGISETTFGSTMQLRYLDYMTFLLRALGYSDSSGDFSWASADAAAVAHGIQTEQERAEIKKQGRFLRDHVAYTSYRALFAKTKDGVRLCDRLVQRGVFSQKQLQAAEQKAL